MLLGMRCCLSPPVVVVKGSVDRHEPGHAGRSKPVRTYSEPLAPQRWPSSFRDTSTLHPQSEYNHRGRESRGANFHDDDAVDVAVMLVA